MYRLIAIIIGLLGLGIIIAEIINTGNFFGSRVALYYVVIPILMLFFLLKRLTEYLQSKSNSSTYEYNKLKGMVYVYYFLLGLIGICLLVGLPYLWWGVIKKLAIEANK